MTKKSKGTVNYSNGMRDSHCGICKHFRASSGTCALVEGRIEPSMWCKLFARRV